MLFALLLAAAAAAPVTIFEGRIDVPRNRSRGIAVEIASTLGIIECRFASANPQAALGAFLLTEEHVRRFQAGLDHDPIEATEPGGAAAFRSHALPRGRYMVLIDNRQGAQRFDTAHVTVMLTPVEPRTLDASRRRGVVAASLGLFALVAAWSGSRLWAAARQQR